jgi:hypothetical protein
MHRDRGASGHLSKLVFGSCQTHAKSFDFAEPAFAFGLGDAGDEVVADLLEAGTLDRIRPE